MFCRILNNFFPKYSLSCKKVDGTFKDSCLWVLHLFTYLWLWLNNYETSWSWRSSWGISIRTSNAPSSYVEGCVGLYTNVWTQSYLQLGSYDLTSRSLPIWQKEKHRKISLTENKMSIFFFKVHPIVCRSFIFYKNYSNIFPYVREAWPGHTSARLKECWHHIPCMELNNGVGKPR